MYRTKRTVATVFFTVLLLGAAIPSSANTIMVYLDYESRAGEPEELVRPLLLDIETGIMDVLFDAGHIVFNMPVASVSTDLSQIGRSQALRSAARDGGAGHLIDVVLELSIDRVRSRARVIGARYRLVDVVDPEVVAAGVMAVENTAGNAESWLALGERIARGAVDAGISQSF